MGILCPKSLKIAETANACTRALPGDMNNDTYILQGGAE